MSNEKNINENEKPKTKRAVPLILILILYATLSYFGLEVFPNIIFLGFYIFAIYNLWYNRKTTKAAGTMFFITLPILIFGIVLILPSPLYEKMILPTVFFAFGLFFSSISILYLLQEKNKRDNCNVLTSATVLDNIKKTTTDSEEDRGRLHFGESRAYSYSPVMEFYVDGEPKVVTYSDGFPNPFERGTKVLITYNRNNPDDICFAEEERVRMFKIVASVFLVFGLIAILVSLLMLI